MGRCFAKHSMTSSKVCSSVRTGAIAGVFTYATSKQMLSMVGGSLNLRRLKFKAIRDGIPLWRKVFDLLMSLIESGSVLKRAIDSRTNVELEPPRRIPLPGSFIALLTVLKKMDMRSAQ